MCTIQSVLNRLKNINPLTKNYVLNLMLAHGRKNCAAMADAIGSSVKPLYSFLSDAKTNTPEIEKYLLQLASETKKDGVLRALVIDPTSIIKPYSKKLKKHVMIEPVVLNVLNAALSLYVLLSQIKINYSIWS